MWAEGVGGARRTGVRAGARRPRQPLYIAEKLPYLRFSRRTPEQSKRC